MLESITTDMWHLLHDFRVNGMRISSRMTVVRLRDSSLWIHSPVPMSSLVETQLGALGKVRHIVAPSKTHHLFIGPCAAKFPGATLWGPPGLSDKRPDLPSVRELSPLGEPAWKDDFEQILFEGIPYGNEFVWLHKASQTLILTDLCQWWRGALPWTTRAYARLAGVREQPAVPRTVRWLVKDPLAARSSAKRILQWDFGRVILSHNAIIERHAKQALIDAFRVFM